MKSLFISAPLPGFPPGYLGTFFFCRGYRGADMQWALKIGEGCLIKSKLVTCPLASPTSIGETHTSEHFIQNTFSDSPQVEVTFLQSRPVSDTSVSYCADIKIFKIGICSHSIKSTVLQCYNLVVFNIFIRLHNDHTI